MIFFSLETNLSRKDAGSRISTLVPHWTSLNWSSMEFSTFMEHMVSPFSPVVISGFSCTREEKEF